jgi:hypothetical protein
VIQPVHGVLADAAGTRAFTNRDAGTIKAADATVDMVNAADMRGAKAGDRTNADATNVSTAAETAAHVSAATEAATSPAARKRVSGQSPGESGSRSQNDHSLA